MAKLARDLASPIGGLPTLHPRESLWQTANLGVLNAETVMAVDGCSSVAVDVRGTFSLTFQLQGSMDGANWTPIPIRPILGGAFVVSVAGTAAGIWRGNCAGFRLVRVFVTAYTSGLAAVNLVASTAIMDDFMVSGAQTPLIVTATGAAAAGVTLTVPSPGVGLRHYITYIRITRFAAALLTAAATPVLVTSTNLPGSPVWSFPADAAAQGTVFVFGEDFAYPIVSSAQNTATTIVCPVTANVIWRVTVGYFNAP
jgi:hypothetical protein